MFNKGDTVRLTDTRGFQCPFCHGKCEYGKISEDMVALVHSMPPCKTYNRLEVPDFILACRRKVSEIASN